MVTRLKGGQLFDPAQGLNGRVQDLFIRDGVMISGPIQVKRLRMIMMSPAKWLWPEQLIFIVTLPAAT